MNSYNRIIADFEKELTIYKEIMKVNSNVNLCSAACKRN